MLENKNITPENDFYDMLAAQYDALFTAVSDAIDHSYEMLNGGC